MPRPYPRTLAAGVPNSTHLSNMKLTPFTLGLAAFVASLIPAFGQSENILVASGKFVPTTSFTETHAEKLVRYRDWTDVVVAGRFAARIVANLADFDPAEISPETAIGVSIGDFDFSATVGDLIPRDRFGNAVPLTSKFKGGVFYYTVEKLDRNGDTIYNRKGDPVLVKVGSVAVTWTASTLTINIKVLDKERAGVGGVIEPMGLLGLADDGVSGGTINFANEAVPVAVTFGSASGENSAFARGNTKAVYRKVDGEPVALYSAGITAAADVVAPTLLVTVPEDDAAEGSVAITGTVTDLAAGTLPDSTSGQFVDVEVYLNDPEFMAPIVADEVSEPDATGKRTFSFSGIPVDVGENTLVIVAIDQSGNQTVITKKVNGIGELPVN